MMQVLLWVCVWLASEYNGLKWLQKYNIESLRLCCSVWLCLASFDLMVTDIHYIFSQRVFFFCLLCLSRADKKPGALQYIQCMYVVNVDVGDHCWSETRNFTTGHTRKKGKKIKFCW